MPSSPFLPKTPPLSQREPYTAENAPVTIYKPRQLLTAQSLRGALLERLPPENIGKGVTKGKDKKTKKAEQLIEGNRTEKTG